MLSTTLPPPKSCQMAWCWSHVHVKPGRLIDHYPRPGDEGRQRYGVFLLEKWLASVC
jgi:hypothetical protein